MGNSHGVCCPRCLHKGTSGDLGAHSLDGSRLIVAVEDFSDAAVATSVAATPAESEATTPGNGSNNTPATGESESLVSPSGSARTLHHASFPFTTDEGSMSWLRANRVLFLMRGLPGSGKSTLTRLLSQLYPGAAVCSADAYFTDRATGEYRFVAARLKDAHGACNNLAFDAMGAGRSPVIVDNTNVRRWEFQFFTDLAVRFGYVLLVVVPRTPWRFDAQALANRTRHAVPLEIIEQRLNSWEAAHPIYYAWFVDSADALRLLRLARDFLACLSVAASARRLPPEVPADSARKLLHATARYCGRRGANQRELVAQADYHNRADVQAALGRVFPASVSAIFVTPRSVGFKMDLTPEQLALWDHDAEDSPPGLPGGSRAHVTLATATRMPAVQAGLDLLAALAAAAARPEPGADDLVLVTEWGFARGCGPDACLLTLDEPVGISTMFASSY